MTSSQRVALPGRCIDELLGPVCRHELPPHRCTRRHDCPGDAHKQRTPGRDVYLWDDRPASPWHAHHAGDVWVTFRCRSVHPDLLDAWRSHVGDPYDRATYGLAALETIVRDDGSVLLLGRGVHGSIDLWITIEKVAA